MTDRPTHPRPFTRTALFVLLAGVMAVGGLASAFAQGEDDADGEAPPAGEETAVEEASTLPEGVVAMVDGEPVTEADLAFVLEDVPSDLSNFPPMQVRAYLVNELIALKAMSQAAREAGMEDSPVYQERLQYLTERALRRAYFVEEIEAGVTPEEVRATYDAAFENFEPRPEVRARHILLTTREDAEAVIAELEAGADFATLAAEKSIDPGGAAAGGDLGYFVRRADAVSQQDRIMVQPFEDAAFALEVGAISEPVESEHGWHVIRLEDRRDSQPPAFENVSEQIRQQLVIAAYQTSLRELRDGVSVEIADPDLAAAVEAQQQAQQPR